MSQDPTTPFDSIEGAHEYVRLLLEAVQEARGEIREDLSLARREGNGAARRLEALQLVAYKLERLEHHTRSSARLLNDLRTLRRLLLGERGFDELEQRSAPAVASAVRRDPRVE